jgi:transposase
VIYEDKKSGSHQNKKLTEEQVVTLIELIDNNNDATLKEIGELLTEKTQVKVSKTTIWKLTKKFNYTWKKKTLYAAEKTSEKVQQKRWDFWQIIKEFRAEDLIFLDEAGVNLAMTRLYARAEKGQRARGEKPQKRGKNVTMIQALSLIKIVASANIYGAVNGLIFEAFVVRKLVPQLWDGAVVIMDNASIHLSKMVRQSIEKAGAKLIYLSPYSPDFSPIENLWSKVKAILKKLEPRTYQELINAITDAMLQVTKNDIHNWFTHCCYCTS